jgi:hypothetical protein
MVKKTDKLMNMDDFLLHVLKYKELLDKYYSTKAEDEMDDDDLWQGYRKLKAEE